MKWTDMKWIDRIILLIAILALFCLFYKAGYHKGQADKGMEVLNLLDDVIEKRRGK